MTVEQWYQLARLGLTDDQIKHIWVAAQDLAKVGVYPTELDAVEALMASIRIAKAVKEIESAVNKKIADIFKEDRTYERQRYSSSKAGWH